MVPTFGQLLVQSMSAPNSAVIMPLSSDKENELSELRVQMSGYDCEGPVNSKTARLLKRAGDFGS